MNLDPTDQRYFKKLKDIYDSSHAESDRIYIRRLRETDIDENYISYYQNQDLVKYMYQTPREINRDSLLKELNSGLETGHYHMYGVFDTASDLIIGNIRIGFITHLHKISDLAIFIGNPSYLGKGFAQEAIHLGNQICFGPYDFRKLHGGMFEENMASVKAYLKTGWVIEGRLRGQYWVNNGPMDRICVACFNPKYFDETFLLKVKENSEIIFKNKF